MLNISIIWQIVTAFCGTTIWPLIKKIPWQVWVGLAAVLFVLWYGHYKENKGYNKCQIETKAAAQKEIDRQHVVALEAIAKAKKREEDANTKLETIEKELSDALTEAKKLKQANQVCLPSSVTTKLRRLR